MVIIEFRVLSYFLTVAKEENISKAAETLHITQPTLSRQLCDLEEELGVQLLIRGKRKTTLTDAGLLLRKRAEEIIALTIKTKQEFLLVYTDQDSSLCFRRLQPQIPAHVYPIWKKQQLFSKAATLFLSELQKLTNTKSE